MSTEEEKKAVQAQRDAIKVTQNKAAGEEKPEEETNEETNENNDAEGEDTNEEGSEETNEENNEEGEETNEEGEEAVEKVETKSVEKLEKTIERLQKRIDKKTGSEKTLQKQLDALQKQLEAKQAEGEAVLTEDEVQTRAERIAAERVAEKEFTRACNKLAEDATKVDKKFDDKVKEMGEEIGPIPSAMIGILEDLDNGGAILAHLVNNVDDAEEIYKLPLPKMALKLSKLSTEIAAKAKPKKQISNVPEPNEPVTASSKTVAFDPTNPKISDKDWIERRNKQVADRAAAKRAAYR